MIQETVIKFNPDEVPPEIKLESLRTGVPVGELLKRAMLKASRRFVRTARRPKKGAE